MKTELADYHVLTAEMEDLPKNEVASEFLPSTKDVGHT